MNPFEIHGPGYLIVYFSIVGTVYLAVSILRINLLEGFAKGADRSGEYDPKAIARKLEPYEAAYLVGGDERVLLTACASLSRHGLIDIDTVSSKVTITDAAKSSVYNNLDSIEKALLNSVRSKGESISSCKLIINRATDSIVRKLVHYGLLVDCNIAPAPQLIAGSIYAATCLLMAVPRMFEAAAANRPYMFLLCEMIMALLFGLSLFKTDKFKTSKGNAVLQALSSENSALRLTHSSNPASLSLRDCALAYGIFGAAALAGDPFQLAYTRLHGAYSDHPLAVAAAVAVAAVAVVGVVADVVANMIEQQVVETSPAHLKTAPQLGIGFRPELARFIEQQENIQFVEIVAEDYMHLQCIPQALRDLQKRGITIIPHSLSLSVGGAERVAPERIKHLNDIARYFDSPFVSDHIAFVRAGNIESGHLLPVRRTESNLAVVCENIKTVKAGLGVPLVLENIACTFDWPDNDIDEVTFVKTILERTDTRLLLDVSNLFANSHNLGFSAVDYLNQLPLERLEYVHMAGGIFKKGLYHDSHCHSLKSQSIDLLKVLKSICAVPRVMLERDDSFPPIDELVAELEAINNA